MHLEAEKVQNFKEVRFCIQRGQVFIHAKAYLFADGFAVILSAVLFYQSFKK